MDLCSPNLSTLIPAMVAAQTAFGRAVKDARNDHFGSAYTSLASALEAVLPALNGHGLAVAQQTHLSDTGVMMLRTTLLHASGEWIASEYPIQPTKPDPQGYGSALTYARRYALMALVGIAPEDDDGNLASFRPTEAPRRKARGNYQPRAKIPRELTNLDLDALATELADAIDDAPNVARLDELIPSLQMLPSSLLPPLRRRFSLRRAELHEGATSDAPGEGGISPSRTGLTQPLVEPSV